MTEDNPELTPETGEEQVVSEEISEIEEPTTSEAVEAEAEDSETDQPAPKPSGVEKRIGELTRKRYQAEREAEYWRQKALETNQAPTESKSQSPAPPAAEPQVDQFGTYEDYLRAMARWEVQQSQQQAEQARRQQQARETAAARHQQYLSRVDQAREKYEDFDDVAHGNHWSPTAEMAEAIQESKLGADIAYFLGSNPDEARRISGLSPLAQAREIGRIEARVAESTPAKQSSAPPPVKPSGSRAKAVKSLQDSDWDSFVERRRKTIAQRT